MATAINDISKLNLYDYQMDSNRTHPQPPQGVNASKLSSAPVKHHAALNPILRGKDLALGHVN